MYNRIYLYVLSYYILYYILYYKFYIIIDKISITDNETIEFWSMIFLTFFIQFFISRRIKYNTIEKKIVEL